MRVFVAGGTGVIGRRLVPQLVARGHQVTGMMTEGRGFSNAKAKRELGWELRYPSWRQGFKEELA
jgi:nucleoside-diphosphate-sugar epimerase